MKKEANLHTTQIIELGVASELTLGANKGWWEFARPTRGHPGCSSD